MREGIPLFRFDPKLGFAGFATDLIGTAPFKNEPFVGGRNYLVDLRCTRPPTQGIVQAMKDAASVKSFFYRIPGNAEIRVGLGAGPGPRNTVVTEERTRMNQQIAQYGTIAFLPAKSLSAKSRMEFALSPITGGLQKVTVGRTAFDPQLINRVGNAVEPLVGAIRAEEAADDAAADASRAAREARAAASKPPSAVDKLKAELELLDLQVKIKEAKAKLNPPPTKE